MDAVVGGVGVHADGQSGGVEEAEVLPGQLQGHDRVGDPVADPDPLVAEMAAQYLVPPTSPVSFTATLWKLESVKPSVTAVVELVGDPLVPLVVHQGEVARS